MVIPRDYTYSRLINHLKGTIGRVRDGKVDEQPVSDVIRNEFKEGYIIASRCSDFIENETKTIVSEGEKTYMAIHIERLKKLI